MGKLKQKLKKTTEVSVKPKEQEKFKKNKNKNQANKQKVPLIKKNAVATATASPAKVKKTTNPTNNLSELVSPVAPGKVKPKKEPAKKKKQTKKPNPTPNGDAAENQPKEDAGKTASPGKLEKKPKKNKIQEKGEKKVYDPEDQNRTIFVGNLAPNTKSHQLKQFCSRFGEVKTVRLRTADGKRLFKHKMRLEAPALNAYVVLKSEESVAKAVAESGCEFKGRHIRITKATKSHDESDSKRVIFVGNLKFTATDEKLHGIFSTCGEIEYVRTLQSEKGCKGVAYIGFKKPESVTLALELNNTMLDERPIRVERYSKYKQDSKKKQNDEKHEKVQKQTGAAKRIADKSKKGKNVNNTKNGKDIKQAPKEIKKKSEFRGVKVDTKKNPKKKKPSAMLQLAKKIAPKN